NYLNPERNSFYILAHGEDYIQCAGSKELCTVELRAYQSDGSFRHYVFCDPWGSEEQVLIPMSAGAVNRQRKHCFHFRAAIELFDCYYRGEPWPSGLALEDITDEFA